MASVSFSLMKRIAPAYLFFLSTFCLAEDSRPIQVNPSKSRPPVKKPSKILKKTLPIPKKPASSFSSSLGVSELSYQEGNYANISSLVLTGKIGYFYLIPDSKWDIGLNAYVTLVPIRKDPSGIGSRFIGVNARTGYSINLPNSWKLSLYGGLYYTTMLVDQNRFGFSNLMGAQLYPKLRKIFSFGVLSSYFKFSPVIDSISDFNLAHREIAFGLSWSFPAWGERNQFSLSIDQAKLSTAIDSIPIQSNSTTLNFGISF